jgi:hypothetical protein
MTGEPNAPSVFPGRAEMQVQFCDADPERLAVFEKTLYELIGDADRAGPCHVEIEPMARNEPRPMDPGFQAQIEAAAERHAPGMHTPLPYSLPHDGRPRWGAAAPIALSFARAAWHPIRRRVGAPIDATLHGAHEQSHGET